jgi:hypothetical protein
LATHLIPFASIDPEIEQLMGEMAGHAATLVAAVTASTPR